MKTYNVVMSLFITGAVMTSCNNGKQKNETVDTNTTTKTELETSKNEVSKAGEKELKIMTREYAMKDGSEISYSYTEDGITSLKDWSAYNTLSYEMGEIEAVDFKATDKRISDLYGTIMSLGDTVPAWLKTEEVMEDVSDIQKEYKELIEEKNAPAKERKENLEELNEQFEDFREELNETIDEYLKINEEAIAKFDKKMKKGKPEKAVEKFNDKMDEKSRIPDYKEKTNK